MRSPKPAETKRALPRVSTRAYDLNPRRRDTLLALARWHTKEGAYAAALRHYEELIEAYPNDIEASLERFVLGQVTGKDPNANEAAGHLAGLIREELKEVAKDEVGRAALVFAVSDFRRGDYEAWARAAESRRTRVREQPDLQAHRGRNSARRG